MQDLADSTTNIDTHCKLLSYLQPCNDSLIQSKSAYDWGDGVTVNYATVTATIRLNSSHHRQMSSSSSPDEPHLNDCRSPSCRDDDNKEALSRPSNFDDVSVETCPSLLTPPKSSNSPGSRSGSSNSGSSNEDELDLPDGLLVRIPRRASNSTNNQPRCEPKLKQAKASEIENEHLQLGIRNSSGGSQPHRGITVNLLDEELWKRFESNGNEMIVTKLGR